MFFKLSKPSLSIIVLIGVFSLGLYNLQSAKVHEVASVSIENCIHNSRYKKKLKINSLSNDFLVTYVENNAYNCCNPHFPAIHITTAAKHNAWLHIVYTDNKEFKVFIDTVCSNNPIYPFYTLEQDFYDAPLWKYSFFSKPFSFWKGHAWAVEVDFQQKIIKSIGGIAWGFNLSYFRLHPTCIEPSSIEKEVWDFDWKIFKTYLYDYHYTL